MRKIGVFMLLLAGCASVPTIPGVSTYKIDIQQGNYVTQEMVSKLKPGMTRAQVRFLLGTPLVVDLFRADRWDYVYVYQKGGKVTQHRKLTVFFDGDKLERVAGDVIPAENGAADAGAGKPASVAAPVKSEAVAAPPASSAAPVKPEGAVLTTTTGEPVATMPPPAEAVKSGAAPEKKPQSASPGDAQPKEERGFFGRMLDKIGF